jgi:hypothetical protein
MNLQIQTTSPIDQLAMIRARIADLELQEKLVRDEVLALGEGRHKGEFYVVEVTMPVRNNLDMKAVRAKLSPQFITAHTTTKIVPTVRVVTP